MLQKLKQTLIQMPDLASFNKSNPAHSQWIGRTLALLRQVNPNDAYKFDLAAGMVGIDSLKELNYTEMRSVLEMVIATLESCKILMKSKECMGQAPNMIFIVT